MPFPHTLIIIIVIIANKRPFYPSQFHLFLFFLYKSCAPTISLLAMYMRTFCSSAIIQCEQCGWVESKKKKVLLYDYIQLKFKVYWNKLTILEDANCEELN